MHFNEVDEYGKKRCSVPVGKKKRKPYTMSQPRTSRQEKRRPAPGKMQASKTSPDSIHSILVVCKCEKTDIVGESCRCKAACKCGQHCEQLFNFEEMQTLRAGLWCKNLQQQDEYIMHEMSINGQYNRDEGPLEPQFEHKCIIAQQKVRSQHYQCIQVPLRACVCAIEQPRLLHSKRARLLVKLSLQ